MSEKKPGCLATLFGLWLLTYMIYIPVYFIILNDEIDAFQEVSLIDIRPELSEVRSAFKQKYGIDIDISLKKALRKNDDISNIKWEYGSSENGVIDVIMTCNHKKIGSILLSAYVRERSFLKVKLSEFMRLHSFILNGNAVSNPPRILAEIARSIYGLEDNGLQNFYDVLNQIF